MRKELKFEVVSKLGRLIRSTTEHWNVISGQKHPEIKGKEKNVIEAITDSFVVRKSIKDKSVALYYKKFGKYYYCAVVRHLNGEGFLITAYITKNVKEGETIWKK